MLRESIELSGEAEDLSGLADMECKEIPGIACSRELIAFCDTFMGGDQDAYAGAREVVLEALGEAALVDAVGVASNFQRMVRIADCTGIPSDGPMIIMAAELSRQMGTDRYQSASNTKPLPLWRKLFYRFVAIPGFHKMVRRLSGRGA